ncbi:MAG: type II secretion system protein GspM [Caldimonas sp.]
MSAEGLSLPPATGSARAEVHRFWQSLAPRERQMVVAVAIVLVVFVVWLVAVQPALRTLRETPSELDRLELQLQQMQMAALESETLRGASPVPAAQAAEALRAATERLGGKGKLAIQGDRATLTFTGVPFPALRTWLGEARSGARARPVEAQLLKGAGGYNGTISLTMPGAS